MLHVADVELHKGKQQTWNGGTETGYKRDCERHANQRCRWVELGSQPRWGHARLRARSQSQSARFGGCNG